MCQLRTLTYICMCAMHFAAQCDAAWVKIQYNVAGWLNVPWWKHVIFHFSSLVSKNWQEAKLGGKLAGKKKLRIKTPRESKREFLLWNYKITAKIDTFFLSPVIYVLHNRKTKVVMRLRAASNVVQGPGSGLWDNVACVWCVHTNRI